jgi:hypothetical protein
VGTPDRGNNVRDFLKAFGKSWLTAMSGILSVVFWGASAILAPFNIPVSVHIGFILAAALGLVFASFRVRRNAVMSGAESLAKCSQEAEAREAMLNSKIAELTAKLTVRADHRTIIGRLRDFERQGRAILRELEGQPNKNHALQQYLGWHLERKSPRRFWSGAGGEQGAFHAFIVRL